MHTEQVVLGVVGVLLLLLLLKKRMAAHRAQRYLDESKNGISLALGRILDSGEKVDIDTRKTKAKLTVIKG